MRDGKLVGSTILENPAGTELPPEYAGGLPAGAMIVEHNLVDFANYPHEWAPEMLRSAAFLTLELASSALQNGFILKDATPYNLIFDGSRPLFVDVLSVRRRAPLESVWQPYGQFVRTFILPLLAFRYFGLRPDELFLSHRDGMEPERLLSICPLYRLLTPAFLTPVTIPVLLARGNPGSARQYRVRHARDADEAAFLLEGLFARARRLLERSQGRAAKAAASVIWRAATPIRLPNWRKRNDL
jgi:hypothetical protein